jgi:holo-[acyl-carrier protein] synthase
MIHGIGTDVVQVERIARIFERHGERFVEHLLMPQEAAAFRDHKRPVRFLAMRFAAKEAVVKAMGTGFAHGMWLRDCGVTANEFGKPEIIWSDRGRKRCRQLGIGESHVTLTDEAGLVVAVAVLMKREVNSGRRTTDGAE